MLRFVVVLIVVVLLAGFGIFLFYNGSAPITRLFNQNAQPTATVTANSPTQIPGNNLTPTAASASIELRKISETEYQLIVTTGEDFDAVEIKFSGNSIFTEFNPAPIYDAVLQKDFNSDGTVDISIGKLTNLNKTNTQKTADGYYILGTFTSTRLPTGTIQLVTNESLAVLGDNQYGFDGYSFTPGD